MVIVSYRQMHGAAPPRRTFHRSDCPRLKARSSAAKERDYAMAEADAVAAGYKPCEWCIVGSRYGSQTTGMA